MTQRTMLSLVCLPLLALGCGPGGEREKRQLRREIKSLTAKLDKADKDIQGGTEGDLLDAARILGKAYEQVIDLRARVLPTDPRAQQLVELLKRIEAANSLIAQAAGTRQYAWANAVTGRNQVLRNISQEWTPVHAPPPITRPRARVKVRTNGGETGPEPGLVPKPGGVGLQPGEVPPTTQPGQVGLPGQDTGTVKPPPVQTKWLSPEALAEQYKHKPVQVYDMEIQGDSVALWGQVGYPNASVADRIIRIKVEFQDKWDKTRGESRVVFENKQHAFQPNWADIENSLGKVITAGSAEVSQQKPLHFVAVLKRSRQAMKNVVKVKVMVILQNLRGRPWTVRYDPEAEKAEKK